MVPAPFVSVVITVLNAERYLPRCLDSLLAVAYPKDRYEVVIVDAQSKDRTPAIVQEYAARTKGAPEVRLFAKPGSIGVGRNEGVRHARGEFVAVTDGDMVVSQEWLRELLAGFALGERIGAVGGPNNTATRDVASLSVACIPVHGPTLDEVPLLGRNRYRAPFVSSTDWYTNVTRNSMYRKDVLDAVGGFAEELISTEDPELNARIHQAGWRTAYNPKAVVFHHHRGSLGAFYRQQRHYAYGHADTTKKRPYMRKPKQFLPAAGLALLVLLALLGLAWRPAWVALGVLLLLALLGLLQYGLRAALIHKDARLVLSAPASFAAWQLAWAIHYPRRLLQVGRETVLTSD
ncbi:MAG: glycosyltransferase [Halobacteriales archaeon]|nr:glycosyltransferase [Halobacteriales archaeon]